MRDGPILTNRSPPLARTEGQPVQRGQRTPGLGQRDSFGRVLFTAAIQAHRAEASFPLVAKWVSSRTAAHPAMAQPEGGPKVARRPAVDGGGKGDPRAGGTLGCGRTLPRYGPTAMDYAEEHPQTHNHGTSVTTQSRSFVPSRHIVRRLPGLDYQLLVVVVARVTVLAACGPFRWPGQSVRAQ